jgi:arylsulfatase
VPNGTPNILVIWGDDIGITNLSCYSDGLMGYRTPNIDRIANEGMRFTDSYGEQSCTAGRAAFISGQSVYRTGMSKVGIPGADVGWAAEDSTIAELLKPLGYATGQFGKNHFGDMNKHLPTVHGFDEFFGNLYHLNAEEEPEQFDYPHKDQFPKLYELALPRGVLKCRATDEESKEPDDPKFGAVGKQVIEDTGALDTKRMETIDDETTGACIDYIKRQHEAGTPFFVWMNMTHMHLYTHTKPESRGQAGLWQSEYHDTMIDHDRNVGQLLDCLDELGIAEDTIVVYSTDNGPHRNSWPDPGTTPFRSEKDTNWEGAFRVPEMVRWSGKIKAGGGMIYFSDDCDVLGIRADNWKIVFMEQRCPGTLQVWFEPFTPLRAPKLFNLRTDPYEHADVTSNTYWDWLIDRLYLMFYGSAIVTQFLETFKEFPPRQEPASFTINAAVEQLEAFLASRGG